MASCASLWAALFRSLLVWIIFHSEIRPPACLASSAIKCSGPRYVWLFNRAHTPEPLESLGLQQQGDNLPEPPWPRLGGGFIGGAGGASRRTRSRRRGGDTIRTGGLCGYFITTNVPGFGLKRNRKMVGPTGRAAWAPRVPHFPGPPSRAAALTAPRATGVLRRMIWIWDGANGTAKGWLHCQEDEGTCQPRICD